MGGRGRGEAIAKEKWRELNYDNMKACRGMYKRIMYKEFSILKGRETSILRSNRLALAIQDQYMSTQNDYHFHHQIEMEARHQQHVDRFEESKWFDTTGPTTKLDSDNNNDNNAKISRRRRETQSKQM